jgi:hypothetical protein
MGRQGRDELTCSIFSAGLYTAVRDAERVFRGPQYFTGTLYRRADVNTYAAFLLLSRNYLMSCWMVLSAFVWG